MILTKLNNSLFVKYITQKVTITMTNTRLKVSHLRNNICYNWKVDNVKVVIIYNYTTKGNIAYTNWNNIINSVPTNTHPVGLSWKCVCEILILTWNDCRLKTRISMQWNEQQTGATRQKLKSCGRHRGIAHWGSIKSRIKIRLHARNLAREKCHYPLLF